MIRKKQSSQGVSSIVGVILMVTLSILLASIVSGFAFDLIDNLLQTPAQAGLTFSETYDATTQKYEVRLLWSSQGTVQNLHVIRPNGASSQRITQVGQSIDIAGVSEGADLTVIGTLEDGTQQVVQSYEVGT